MHICMLVCEQEPASRNSFNELRGCRCLCDTFNEYSEHYIIITSWRFLQLTQWIAVVPKPSCPSGLSTSNRSLHDEPDVSLIKILEPELTCMVAGGSDDVSKYETFLT